MYVYIVCNVQSLQYLVSMPKKSFALYQIPCPLFFEPKADTQGPGGAGREGFGIWGGEGGGVIKGVIGLKPYFFCFWDKLKISSPLQPNLLTDFKYLNLDTLMVLLNIFNISSTMI